MSEEITGIPLPGDNDAAPSTPIFLQGDDWYAVDVKPYQLDFTKAYEAPQYTLSWNGIPFAPRGGIHAIK